ncbi:MAG: InlB B-repeat-containing protein, partial [Treponema sp.]|nr:InlB B-repeat-containing protein [Treponema sp.]
SSQVPSPSRPSSSGYNFDGWYTIVKVNITGVTGTTEQEVLFTLGYTTVYENLTVYAKWSSGSTGGGTGQP